MFFKASSNIIVAEMGSELGDYADVAKVLGLEAYVKV